MIQGFKTFLLRGNIVELAVAVVIGSAFTGLVTTVTTSLIKPLLAAVGPDNAISLGFQLRPDNPGTLLDVGAVITAVLNFVLVAAVVYFLVVVPMNRFMALRAAGVKPEPAAPAEDVLLLQEIRDLLRAQAR